MKNSPANKVTVHKFTNIYFLRHPYSYSTVWIMKICYGVTAHITHFRFLPISPLIFATVQKFALDYLRDQQILTPPCEWGWVVVVPLLGTTLEVEESPGMVWRDACGHDAMARCSPMDGGCCCKVWRTSSSVSPHNSLGREGGACGYFLAIPPPSHSRLSGHIRLFCTYSSPHFGIHSVVIV